MLAARWKDVAISLGFDVPRIETIERDSFYKHEDGCRKMIGIWLDGDHDLQPATWATLIKCVKKANLSGEADKLRNACLSKFMVRVITNTIVPLYHCYGHIVAYYMCTKT